MSDEERCPRCSSKAFEPEEGCISCGYIPGNEHAPGSDGAAKRYGCKQCPETFPSSQALAGHTVNRHGKRKGGARKKKSRRPQPAGGARARAEHAARTPRARPDPDQPAQTGPPGNGGVCCPTCLQTLPAPAVKIARRFADEGVEEGQALKLALIAHRAAGEQGHGE